LEGPGALPATERGRSRTASGWGHAPCGGIGRDFPGRPSGPFRSVLDVWEAERLEDVLGNGRTHPLVIECVRRAVTTSGGDERDPSGGGVERRVMVVKALGLPEVTQSGLCAELFGNLLAREFGNDTPRPALVDLTSGFIEAAEPALSSWQLRPQPGLAAACEYFRGGFASAVPDAPLTPEELAQAARIYAFDLLVQNPDRRPEKPNCAQRGGRFIVYDFEMAFSFLLVIGQKDEPWEVSKHGLGPKHLFYSALRAVEIDWEPFLKDLAG
jgi:hypothetical protein